MVVLNIFLRDLFLKRKNLVKRSRFHKSILIYFQNIFFLHEISLAGVQLDRTGPTELCCIYNDVRPSCLASCTGQWTGLRENETFNHFFFFLLQDVSIVMMRVKGRAIFGLLWLLNCLCCSQGEVYSSASDMMQVFGLERELVTIINGFANKLQGKLDRINSYLEVIHR